MPDDAPDGQSSDFNRTARANDADMILPGLERLSQGVMQNVKISGSTTVFCMALLSHLKDDFDATALMLRSPFGPDKTPPLLYFSDWYISEVKKWVLRLEPHILFMEIEAAAEAFKEMGEKARVAGEKALSFYDAEDEYGRSYRFRLGQLQLAMERLQLREAEAEVAQVGARVAVIAEHAAEAAGSAAKSSMAAFFERHAESERRRYRLWIGALALSVVCSVGFAALVVFEVGETLSASRQLARLALVLPALALAGYASRQANYHRDAEASSRIIALRLRTVSAFTDPLDSESRIEIMRSLGKGVFAGDAGGILRDPAQSYGIPSEVAQLLQGVIDSRKGQEK